MTLRSAVALTLLAAAPAGAAAQDYYFLMVFGSESTPKHYSRTHTFATVVKATGNSANPADYRMEAHTISWMPASGNIRPLALRPERGTNLDLAQSLQNARASGERTAMWGPYQIDRATYDAALQQKARLESGQVLYKTISPNGGRTATVSNCVHAVAAIGDPSTIWDGGQSGTAALVTRLQSDGLFRNTNYDHAWVAGRVGIDPREIPRAAPLPLPRR